MKVLFINSVCGTGSTGKMIADTVRYLCAEGHNAYVIYGVGEAKNIDPSMAYKISNKADYYLHNALSRFTDRAGLYSFKATQDAIKEIKKYRPDIIHLHNLHGYYINYKMLFQFLKEYKKPVVWTLHDCWAFTGHCAHFTACGCEKWKNECSRCPQPCAYPVCYTSGNAQKNFNLKKKLFTSLDFLTLVSPSKWLAGCIKDSFLKNIPVKIINNGIDKNIFKPVESSFKERFSVGDKKIVLGVSNVWSEKKGLKYYLALAEMLPKEYQMALVGLSEKQVRELPDNILKFTRTQNAQELAEFYSAADVFVNLSLEDTFPTVNIEALSCGTPVIMFRSGGGTELINENNGAVVEMGNVKGVLEKIQTLGAGNQQTIAASVKELRYQNTAKKYSKLYYEILNNHQDKI